MKRILIVVFVRLLSLTLISADIDMNKKFFVSIKGNFLFPSDSSYKDVYG